MTLEPLLDVVLAASLLLGVPLLALSVVAYVRRPTRSILLLVGAFAALCGNSLVAVLMLAGVVSEAVHHLAEHALVFVESGLVLAAVYYARSVERRASGADESSLIHRDRSDE